MTASDCRLYLCQSELNAVSTLVRVCPESVLPLLVMHCINVLSNSAIATVTRDEVALLHWPEGQLYDKSIIDASVSLRCF